MKTFGIKIRSDIINNDKNLIVHLENKKELLKWIKLLSCFQQNEKISYISYEEIEEAENNFIEAG